MNPPADPRPGPGHAAAVEAPGPGPRGAAASLAAAMALAGVYVAAAPLLLAWFPAAILAGLRFALAAIVLLPWLRRPPPAQALSAADHRALLLQALLGNLGFTLLMLEGVARGGALLAGVVMAALPAAVAMLAWALLGERPGPRLGLALACAGAGIALLAGVRHGGTVGPADPWGLPLLVAALGCEAAHAVLGKRLAARHDPRFLTARINLASLLLSLPGAALALPGWSPGAVPALAWLGLLAYALTASLLTVWLWLRGLRGVPASVAGVYTVLLPLSTAAVGLLLGEDDAGPGHAAAYALALAGLWLAVRPPAPAR